MNISELFEFTSELWVGDVNSLNSYKTMISNMFSVLYFKVFPLHEDCLVDNYPNNYDPVFVIYLVDWV